jgi:hypothetical protein
MSKKMMRHMEKQNQMQNVSVMNPAKFENRNDFFMERKQQRLQVLESEVMKSCSFQPTIFSVDAKPTLRTQPKRTKSKKSEARGEESKYGTMNQIDMSVRSQ